MGANRIKTLPELLSPAGSFDSFRAAIDGGADAIYVGGSAFNARINAKNFTEDEFGEAVKLAHAYGVKVYQTVNTMIFDRELDALLRAVEGSAKAGVDAFIVSDLGAAELIRQRLPDIPLHASTQLSVHNASGARLLAARGFTRVVPARELSRGDIAALVRDGHLEVEIFIHGALCVSHSGQCLFSSLVGGRSGNRGLCAQPCRLPYGCDRAGDKYPLSLKDLSLATHIEEIIDSGVASLKIEGRMKSPEYVRGVTAIWRRLLDCGKDASAADMRELAELFSRGGFTDAYYTKTVGRGMLGVRSEDDKQASREVEKFNKIARKVPIDIEVALRVGEPSRLTLSCGDTRVTVTGDAPQTAINAPIDELTVRKCMSKLGDTPFCLAELSLDMQGSLMMPISSLNALRRSGAQALCEAVGAAYEVKLGEITKKVCQGTPQTRNVARFYRAEQITDRAREFFDVVLLPLDEYVANADRADGLIMPPVIFDSEWSETEKKLCEAAKYSPRYVLVTNVGQIEAVKERLMGASMIADLRFNVGNGRTAAVMEELGFDSFVVSAELTPAQIRDIGGAKAAAVYGRLPLMTLEKCAIKAIYGEKRACEVCAQGKAQMTDRRGVTFPILRESEHRNVIYNSLPTSMSDKQDELARAGITDRHFIFTVENVREIDRVIEAYESGVPLDCKVRRI